MAANKAFSGIHCDCANGVLAKMLGDFQNQFILDPLHFKCVENWRQIAFELYIHHSTNDLRHLANGQ